MLMNLEYLPQTFTVCKIAEPAAVNLTAPFSFLSRTDTEVSLVCPSEKAPAQTLAREDGWRALRVQGAMAFTLVGVLSELTGLLARHEIPVFAVSTFDTDYLFVKAEHWARTLDVLRNGGHTVAEATGEIRKNG
jgi:uncharacterized protein